MSSVITNSASIIVPVTQVKPKEPNFKDLRLVLRILDHIVMRHPDRETELFLSHLRFLKRTKQGNRAFTMLQSAVFPIPVYLNDKENNSVEGNKLFLDLGCSSFSIIEKNGLRYFFEEIFSVVTVFHELLHLIVLIREVESFSKDKNYKREIDVDTFVGSSEYSNLEEFYVINGTSQNSLSENALRRELGLPERVSHKGLSKILFPKTIPEQLHCYAAFNLTGDLTDVLKERRVTVDQIIQSKALDASIIRDNTQVFEILRKFILENDSEGAKKMSPALKLRDALTLNTDNVIESLLICITCDLSDRLHRLLGNGGITSNQIFRSRALTFGIKNQRLKMLKMLVNYISRVDPKGVKKMAMYLKWHQLLELVQQDSELMKIFGEAL